MPEKKYPFIADIKQLQARIGTGYPSPYDEPCRDRSKTILGDEVGVSQFGVNLLVLKPGCWSSQRHWHEREDEFIFVLEGEVSLVTDEGESLLKAGAMAGFPAGQENGHHLVNIGKATARVLEVGTRAQNETAVYSDIDMKVEIKQRNFRFMRKNGEPLE